MKKGLMFYTVDTDRYQDMRIKRLKKNFGCNGIAVYDYLLCEIYRVQGCGSVWDEDTAFDVAEYFELRESVVREIVKYCGYVGLFDSELLSRGIITSASIQRRYFDMATRAKRKDVSIPPEWRLIEIPEETPKIPELSAKLPEETAKVREVFNKRKESKRNKINSFSSLSSFSLFEQDETGRLMPQEEQKKEIYKIFFFEKGYPRGEYQRFVDYNTAGNWGITDKNSSPRDPVALAKLWKPEKDVQQLTPQEREFRAKQARIFDETALVDTSIALLFFDGISGVRFNVPKRDGSSYDYGLIISQEWEKQIYNNSQFRNILDGVFGKGNYGLKIAN